jgi:hypothetical protein
MEMRKGDEEGKGRTKYDDGHIDRAEHTELVCLLEETVLALWINDEQIIIIISAKPGENKNSREATFKKVTERLRSCYDKKLSAIASQRWKREESG